MQSFKRQYINLQMKQHSNFVYNYGWQEEFLSVEIQYFPVFQSTLTQQKFHLFLAPRVKIKIMTMTFCRIRWIHKRRKNSNRWVCCWRREKGTRRRFYTFFLWKMAGNISFFSLCVEKKNIQHFSHLSKITKTERKHIFLSIPCGFSLLRFCTV